MGATLSDDDVKVIARAMHRVRPEWDEPALRLFLRNDFADGVHPFHALMVAAMFVACDHRLMPSALSRPGHHWIAAADASHPRAPDGIP